MSNVDNSAENMVLLGSTDIRITPMGVGAWAWGSRNFWGYGVDYGASEVRAAFDTSIAAGINFFDTAEFYGNGLSEKLLGQFIRESGKTVVVTTKFWPYPWRLTRGSLRRALQRSLKRLGMERVDVYMLHWPWPPVPLETWVGAIADAVEDGLVRAPAVANCNLKQMRRAQDVLDKRGLALAANQVPYSLLNRDAERSGLLRACRESGVTLIAYSPLAQGLLTGKYRPGYPPGGIRRRYSGAILARAQPRVALLREIGEAHGGKTPAQVALNWVMRKGAVPIPGAKNARQAEENAGALGWALTDDEVATLDAASE